MTKMKVETSEKLLNPMFTSAFGCRFDSDLIDLNDKDDIEGLAETVVGDLLLRGMTTDEILRPLEKALAIWGPDVLDEFSQASNGDWSFNAEVENDLKFIISTMIDTARSRSLQSKAAE